MSELVGTCRWMAPETMCDGLFLVEHRIFGLLGMVYFELASRQVPYQSLAQDIQIMYRLFSTKAETVPTQCRFEVPQFATLVGGRAVVNGGEHRTRWAAVMGSGYNRVQAVPEQTGPRAWSTIGSLESAVQVVNLKVVNNLENAAVAA